MVDLFPVDQLSDHFVAFGFLEREEVEAGEGSDEQEEEYLKSQLLCIHIEILIK